MKYSKYLMLLTIPAFMASCSSDFLDKDVSKNASEEQIQDAINKNPAAIDAFISGYYKNLFAPEAQKAHDDFGLKAFELATDLMGGDMAMNTQAFFVFDYMLDNRLSMFRRTTTFYQELYAVINGANDVIAKLLLLDVQENDEVKAKLGQSYSLRAYMYYWLVNMYQQPYQWNKDKPGIPLYTEKETRLERVPVKEIYTQMLADAKNGYELLKGKKSSDKSKINEFAAAAIYANILSFVDDAPDQWNEVAKYAKEAIKGGSLMSHEALLSGFNDINLSEVLWGSDINTETNTFYASFMSHMDPKGPGYGGDLAAYKMISSDLYDKIADDDIRKQWFGIELSEKDPNYNVKQYIQTKFSDTSTMGTGDVFASDYIYLRTGEMYFVAAEALYRANKPDEAKNMLNEIMKTRNPNYNFNGTGQALLDEICLQKRIEMWGEGKRLFDMKRRNEDLDRSKGTNHHELVKKNPIVKAGSNLFIYQIPEDELKANSAITEQND